MTDEEETLYVKLGGKHYIYIGDTYTEMGKPEKYGRCVCCGGDMTIEHGSNVIYIYCEKNDDYNFQCSLADGACAGIEMCVNKDEMEAPIVDIVMNRVRQLIDEKIEIFDVVLVSSTPETRKVVADRYFQNTTLRKTELNYKDSKIIKIDVLRKSWNKIKEYNKKLEEKKKDAIKDVKKNVDNGGNDTAVAK